MMAEFQVIFLERPETGRKVGIFHNGQAGESADIVTWIQQHPQDVDCFRVQLQNGNWLAGNIGNAPQQVAQSPNLLTKPIFGAPVAHYDALLRLATFCDIVGRILAGLAIAAAVIGFIVSSTAVSSTAVIFWSSVGSALSAVFLYIVYCGIADFLRLSVDVADDIHAIRTQKSP